MIDTSNKRLHLGLLRQHFFFGWIPPNLLDFTCRFRFLPNPSTPVHRFREWLLALRQSVTWSCPVISGT
jgi:hypothetical protein